MTRLVLLSGWGGDARIWQPLALLWPAGVTVETPDWPGYGAQPALEPPADLEALARAFADELPRDAVWVGWSLGGLLATTLLGLASTALPPPRGLIQIGMGPRFCHPEGVTQQEFGRFRRAFARDPDATLAHFRRWMLRGEASPRNAYRHLLDLLGEGPPPDVATLAAGLQWLAELDNSRLLAEPPCPMRLLSGTDDPLLSATRRQDADRTIDGAGHCPMLSRPDTLVTTLIGLSRECLGSRSAANLEVQT